MNLRPGVALLSLLLLPFLARAASHPYFEFAQRFTQGQSSVRVALETPSGVVVYSAVLLRNEPESIQVWSPDWTKRLTIPQLRWPLLESVSELDGLRVGDQAACDNGSGTRVRRGALLAIDRNPMRAVYTLSTPEGTDFFARCAR